MDFARKAASHFAMIENGTCKVDGKIENLLRNCLAVHDNNEDIRSISDPTNGPLNGLKHKLEYKHALDTIRLKNDDFMLGGFF